MKLHNFNIVLKNLLITCLITLSMEFSTGVLAEIELGDSVHFINYDIKNGNFSQENLLTYCHKLSLIF